MTLYVLLYIPTGDQLMGKYVFFSAHIMDCLTDNKLREIAFSVFLKLVALPSASASIHDPEVDKRLKYAIQLLWELHKKSGHSLKQRFAEYVSKEPHLVTFTLKRMCSCLESYGKFMITSSIQHKIRVVWLSVYMLHQWVTLCRLVIITIGCTTTVLYIVLWYCTVVLYHGIVFGCCTGYYISVYWYCIIY